MLIAKQQILRLIKDLPDKVDIDEVMYRLYLRQKSLKLLRKMPAGGALFHMRKS